MKSRFMMTLRLCVSRCPSASLTALSDHDAHREVGDTFLFGKTEGVSDIVAVMYEGLRWEVGKAGAEVIFALGSGVDNEFRATRARATCISLRMELTKASEEKGRTMPEVPIIEIPPVIPSLGLKVF